MSQTSDTALLGAIMHAAVDAIIISDADGIVSRANRAAGELFGYSEADLVGKNVNILMPDALARRHDGFMTRYRETGENRIIDIGREVEGLRSDGSIFPVHLSVGHTEFEGQKLFVGILHDLSQRRAAQEALTRSQRLDAIGQMTGGIAHDFNNLLTVIIGNLELLEMRSNDDRLQELARDALEAAELGVDLTTRLKVFARKSDLKPVPADLREICDTTLSMLKRTLGSNYEVATQYASEVSPVAVDPGQLQSAIVNLAMNAKDAMPGGGKLVFDISRVAIDDTYIAQEVDIARGTYMRLSVSDNGGGMTPEAQRRAFEPFFTTKGETGTGLGLAMVHGFVRQSGGYIALYSELGLGSSFGLYFPVLGEVGPVQPARATAKKSASLGHGQHVLIVEDNPMVLKLSVERVRDLGFVAHQATSGDEAYAMLQSGLAVDAVVSDLVMPGTLNGYDLAAKVRAEFPDIKLLLTSGYASDVVSASLPHDVEYDILHKPYRQADLAARLSLLLPGEGET